MAVALLSGYEILGIARNRQRKRVFFRFLWLAAVLLFSMLHMRAELQFRERELSQIKDGETVTIQGEIYKKEFKHEQTTCYLKDVTAVLSNSTIPCNHIIAYLDGEDYLIGETLLLQGKVNRFEAAANEGGFDTRKFYASQKIDFALWNVKMLKKDGRKDKLAEGLCSLRKRIFNVYENAMDQTDSGVLSVMILGEKSGLDSEIKKLYQDSGISHVLAISGLHISLIGMGIYRFLRKKGLGFVQAGSIAFLFVFLYVIMAGNGVSARRAAGMFFIAIIADMLGRAYDPLNALGLMVIVMLWENPFLIEYTGFLFSVTAVLGITITGRLFCIDSKEGEEQTRWQRVQNALCSGLGLWLSTLPLVAYSYYGLPMYAMLLNLLVLPLLPCLFLFGIWGAVIGLVIPRIAFLLLLPCRWILHVYRFLADLSLKLPYAQWIVGKPSYSRILCYYLLLLLLCGLLYYRKSNIKVFRSGPLLRLGGALLLVIVLVYAPKRGFELDILDVGQGDGIYLCTEEGISLFIDGGSSSVKNVGANRILPFLKSKGISHIAYWFVSHADEDHMNGLEEVLESGYQVDVLVIAEAEQNAKSGMVGDEAVRNLIQLAQSQGTQILSMKTGDVLSFEDSEMVCLSPDTEITFLERNDRSLVLLYRDEEFSGIFSGDISSEVEKKLVVSGLCMDVDFYKAAHHGSRYSNSKTFLQALQPEIAVVSCGAGNSYGHPGEEALLHMEEAGAEIYQTMLQGRIRVTKTKKGELVVETWYHNSL